MVILKTPGWALALALVALVACSSPPSPAGFGRLSQVASASETYALAAQPAPPRRTHRLLAVKQHYQDHNLSCEAAALKMALSYEGIAIDELTLMKYMSVDLRPPTFSVRGQLASWGDPAKSYVGNVDGHIERYTGYGVYQGPVARAAIRAGARVLAAGSGLYGSAISPGAIYNAVLDGHPVVAWISNTYHDVPLSRYVAYDGATVWYTLTEHAVTVVGVRPGQVLINDPWFGQAWHSKAQFESAYETFDHMAVIVSR
ncbi:MAG: hypothetical protein QOG08_892 [Chloroflexota bacterium]|nr:hypothetical protein [Chloroflexota bacterium]